MTPVEVLIRTSAQTAALDTVKQKVQAVGQEAGRAAAAGQQLSGRLTAGFSSVLGALSPVALSLAGVTTALLGGLTAGVAYNATLEQQTVAFRTLLGSADAAQRRMRELADFAATTPFELPELVNASRILQSLAGDELGAGDGLRLIGDAAAATGRNFDELAMWAGRLYAGLKSGTPVGEATMRLIEMGAISGETARKLNALAESGGAVNRPFQVLRETFGRFDGAMALQGETFKGLASTLKDTVMGDLAEATRGLTEQLQRLMRGVLEAKGVIASRDEVARQGQQGQLNAYGQRIGTATSAAELEKLRAEITQERRAKSGAARMEAAQLAALRPTFEAGADVVRSPDFGDLSRTQFEERSKLVADQLRYVQELRKLEEAAGSEGARLAAEARARRALPTGPTKEEAARLAQVREQTAQLQQQADVLEQRALPLETQRTRLQERQERLAASAQELNRLALTNELPRQELDLRRAEQRRNELTTAEELADVERGLARERREAADVEADALEDVAKAWSEVESELSAYTREVERLKEQQLSADLQGIRSDWRRTPGEQRDAQLNRGREAVADGTMSGGEFGLLQNQLGPDPRSWADSWTAMLTEMRAQNEAFAQNFVATVGQAFQTTFHLASDGLTAAIFQTDGWERQLARIPLQIGQQIVSAIIRMGLQWVTTQILMATMGKTIQAAAMAGTAPIAAAQSAIWATPATLATIASYGGAAAAAPGFIAVAQGLTLAQSLAAFAEGGLTPGTATLAVVGEKGPELVLPAHVTARLSPAERTALVAGDFSRGGSGGGGPTNVILVDDRDTAARWERERGEAFVLSVMGRNWHRFA
jgi:hypothetical protein